uniref:Uncharacterized protein n=1 Tax=Acrobeloides nanus TaxID=290746 RepID=A0A914DF05_9BILA
MYKYLEFADMPGWGTKANLSATYYKEKKLDTYDGVILFVNVLNDSNLLNVAKQLLDHNINMIFVYAKTDLALIDEVRRDGLTDDGESFDFNHPKVDEMQEYLNKWLSQRNYF